MNTFSYCGINSSTFGCYYVPDENARFDDRADYEVYDEEHDWRDGGVYYGNRVKKRQFALTCYYEQIDRKTRQRMMDWLGRNTEGRLVFDDSPWKYYIVRPTKKQNGKMFSHRKIGDTSLVYSGVFTITFTAYDPFAYLEVTNIQDYYDEINFRPNDVFDILVSINENTNVNYDIDFSMSADNMLMMTAFDTDAYSMTEESQLIIDDKFANESFERISDYINVLRGTEYPNAPSVDSRTFYIYNCGTEVAKPVIRIGGTVGQGGLTIINQTNNTICRIVSLPQSNQYLEIDCNRGLVNEVNGNQKKMDYTYHDLGYITLEPCGFVDNDVTVSYTANSNLITVSGRDYEKSMVGKFVRLDDTWFRIIDETQNGVVLNGTVKHSGTAVVNIVTMNQISISGDNISLNKLQVDYIPRLQ